MNPGAAKERGKAQTRTTGEEIHCQALHIYRILRVTTRQSLICAWFAVPQDGIDGISLHVRRCLQSRNRGSRELGPIDPLCDAALMKSSSMESTAHTRVMRFAAENTDQDDYGSLQTPVAVCRAEQRNVLMYNILV